MKALKILVFVMGAMLIAGISALVWGIATSTHVKTPAAVTAAVTAAAPTAVAVGQPFGSVAVPLAPGAKVEQVLSAGSLVVVRTSENGIDRLTVLDPAAGQVRGDFRLDVPRQ